MNWQRQSFWHSRGEKMHIEKDETYAFPWGFHLGDLHKDGKKIPLFTHTKDGGFTLLYDKASEPKVDQMLESLCLELLTTLPYGSLKIDMFDSGKKKFYSLSALQHFAIFEAAYTEEMMLSLFERLEKMIIRRHQELLCCNRPSITEHNQKSKLKEQYHLVLLNLNNFPTEQIEARRVRNFVESAYYAGVYVIAFDYMDIEDQGHENVQIVLDYFKKLYVKEGDFKISKEIFEFPELLEDHTFEPLKCEKSELLQHIYLQADLEKMIDPENITLEENTKVL